MFSAYTTRDGSGRRLSYSFFSATVRAAHVVFLPFFPPSAQEIAARNITLSAQQNVTEKHYTDFVTSGMAYFMEQTNEVRNEPFHADHQYSSINLQPDQIGLALYDNPVGQLAWMGTLWKTGLSDVFLPFLMRPLNAITVQALTPRGNVAICAEQHGNPYFGLTVLPHSVVLILRLDLRPESKWVRHDLFEGTHRCAHVIQSVRV